MLAVLIHVTQGVKPMSDTMLPFSLAKSNEKLTDRGTIALVDEFVEAIGLPEKVDGEFPAPGSNRGIDPSAYLRTLTYHFSEGGRDGDLPEIRRCKLQQGRGKASHKLQPGSVPPKMIRENASVGERQ